MFGVRVSIVAHPQRDSGLGGQNVVDFGLLLEADFDPAAAPCLDGAVNDDAFPELQNLVGLEVVVALNGVHNASILEVGVHFEQVLP